MSACKYCLCELPERDGRMVRLNFGWMLRIKCPRCKEKHYRPVTCGELLTFSEARIEKVQRKYEAWAKNL